MVGGGWNMQARAEAVCEAECPPEIGWTVFCEMVPAPNKDPRKPPGMLPLWFLVMTHMDPQNLGGPRLRHYKQIGDGAPDLDLLRGEIERGTRLLHELARQRLAARNGRGGRPAPGGAG